MNMIALSQDQRYLENSDGRSMQGIVLQRNPRHNSWKLNYEQVN